MPNIFESNNLIEIHHPNGDIDRIYPVTKAENVKGLGNSTTVQTEALKLLAVNSYIVDDTTGITYKIGIKDGKLYREVSDVSVKDLLDTIKDVVTPENPDTPTDPTEQVDKSSLTNMITTATTNLNNPTNLATSEMKTTFSTAINSAQNVVNNTNATQEDVNSAVTSLGNANTAYMSDSSAIVTARNDLSTMLSTANNAAENTETYTPGSIQLLQTVITASETIYNSTEIYTAQTYINQKNNLQTAISNLSEKANKSSLNEAIESATTDITNSSETWVVTEATLNTFNTALADAQTVANNPNVVQADADNALNALNTAKSALIAEHQAISSARSSLNTAITQATEDIAKTDMYTTASISALQGVLTGASELYNDETIHVAQDYTNKKAELQNAINALVIKVNNSNLVSLIATANSNLNDSTKLATTDMKTTLTDNINAAQEVADNELATETEINNAITTLQQANTAYITSSEEIVTAKNDLNTVISSANTEVAKTTTYTPNSISALQSKLTEAQALYNDDVVHIASDYNTQKNDLQTAINGLTLRADFSELDEYIHQAEEIIDNPLYICTINTRNRLSTAIASAQTVSANKNATQDEVGDATIEVSTATDNLIDESNLIRTARASLNSTITKANTELSKTDTYTQTSLTNLQTKVTEAQNLYNDTTIHPASDYTSKKNEVQSAMDGLVSTMTPETISTLNTALEASSKTLAYDYHESILDTSKSSLSDENFLSYFGCTRAECLQLRSDLQTVKDNCQNIYDQRSTNTISDEAAHTAILGLVKQNLLVAIDKSNIKLNYTKATMMLYWTSSSKSVCTAAIAKAKEVVNRPSNDINEYLTVVEELWSATDGLVEDQGMIVQ